MTRCQFCNKKDWDIILRAEGYILEHINKFLICRDCYRKHILKPMKIKSWLVFNQEAAKGGEKLLPASNSSCEKQTPPRKSLKNMYYDEYGMKVR